MDLDRFLPSVGKPPVRRGNNTGGTMHLITNGPEDAPHTLILAHGAGAPMDSDFMAAFAEGLGTEGLRVVRFEFPYMAKRREDGKRRPPDRQPVLLERWRNVIEHAGGPEGLFIGGKSMGGRMASLLAAGLEAEGTPVTGLVLLGYPFHPPGKPEKTRTEHLEALKTPTLICQGTRDSLGSEQDVAGYVLSSAIRFHWLADGDHGFKPRKASGRTERQNWDEAIAAIGDFTARTA